MSTQTVRWQLSITCALPSRQFKHGLSHSMRSNILTIIYVQKQQRVHLRALNSRTSLKLLNFLHPSHRLFSAARVFHKRVDNAQVVLFQDPPFKCSTRSSECRPTPSAGHGPGVQLLQPSFPLIWFLIKVVNILQLAKINIFTKVKQNCLALKNQIHVLQSLNLNFL